MARKNEVKITLTDKEEKLILKKTKEMGVKIGIENFGKATYMRIAALKYEG